MSTDIRFQDYGDVVFDRRTNLYWEKVAQDSLLTWEEAATYCYKLELGGHKDWRLPTVWELVSIIDYTKMVCVVCGIAYDIFKGNYGSYFWTKDVTVKELGGSWVVDFESGLLDCGNVLSKLHVRAVWDGQVNG